MKFMFLFVVGFAILLLLFVVSYFVSLSFLNTEDSKESSFECGFQPFDSFGIPFSMPFFCISLMFLLFDVEILLVSFYPLFISFSFYYMVFIWVIVIFIFFATSYEWKMGVLSWF
nr:NADH dehydrogenase subunit 3 [Scatoglyphus polytrematus]